VTGAAGSREKFSSKNVLLENFLDDNFCREVAGVEIPTAARLPTRVPTSRCRPGTSAAVGRPAPRPPPGGVRGTTSGSSIREIAMTVSDTAAPGPRPSLDSELTWLLHRAAQHMHNATGEQAGKHGLTLREYIVLSALHKTPGLTQGELGKALSLDKTTLMIQLDRLERSGLVLRRNAPGDRRVRIPEITDSGEDLRATVAEASAAVEASVLDGFDADHIASLRRMLFTIIGDSEDPGSCL
jgi:DNA-binding MarR family transcriptional regulator